MTLKKTLQKQTFRGVLKICSKFTGEHQCRRVISINLLYNFIEITLRHGCSSVNLLHISRTPFTKNTSEWFIHLINILFRNLKPTRFLETLHIMLTRFVNFQIFFGIMYIKRVLSHITLLKLGILRILKGQVEGEFIRT